MRLLHISDLHATATSATDHRLLVEAMLADALAQHHSTPFELAVVTGDLAYSGTEGDLEVAQTLLLDRLTEMLLLSRDRIVIVPGNHDVDRSRIVSFVEPGLAAILTDREAVNTLLDDPNELDRAVERLAPWQRFHERFYQSLPVESAGSLAWVHRFQLPGQTVGVAALNSAWRASGGSTDRGRLLVGDRQLHAALDRIDDCDIRIVAMHHPLDWLQSFDADGCRREFEHRATIVLSGHEHVLNPTAETSPRGNAIYSRVGCLYESRDYPNTYEVLDIDLAGRSVDIRMRTWWPERQQYDQATDMAAGGVLRLSFPSTNDHHLSPQLPYSRVSLSLAALAQEGSVIADRLSDVSAASVEDVLIPPRFLAVPYREAVAAVQLQKGHRPSPIDLVADLTSNRVTVVVGEAESGVTSGLLWLLGRHFALDGTHFPVFLPFDTRFDKHRFPKAVEDAVLLGGFPVGPDGKMPRLLIGLDDVSALYPKALARLARYIAEDMSGTVYVLGCHSDAHEAIATALSENGVVFRPAFLGPFGRQELRQLVEKLVGPSGRDIVDRVYQVIKGEQLPRSPLIMSALIAVMTNDVNVAELNESAILQSYVYLHLGRDDIGDPEGLSMDYRRREHLVGAVARDFMISGVHRKTRLETEELFAGYFRNRGWGSMSPGRVLDSLIKRRILAEDVRGVGFRYPAIEHLFAGKWMLEDPGFADEILSHCMVHGEAVRHAAGLKRSDRALLETVGRAAAAVFDKIGDEVTVEMFDLIEDRHGWSEATDIEVLRTRLKSAGTSAVPISEMDAWIDQIDDGHDADSANVNLISPGPLLSLGTAAELLSDVLRCSELVDDVDFKVEQLKLAIHGWSLVAVVVAVREDQTHFTRDLLVDLVSNNGNAEDDEDRAKVLQSFVGLLMTFAIGIVASSSLGNMHSGALLNAVMEDDGFMSSAAHALFTTLVCTQLRLPGWPERLEKLYRSHRKHPFVAELARTWALGIYLDSTTNTADASKLERFLADIYTQGVGSGPNAVAVRALARDSVLKELRSKRKLAPRMSPAIDVLDPLDEDIGKFP